METLKSFIKILLLTGYIENEKAVSCIIVGKPESGKSSLIGRIVTNKGTLELTDITAWGIAQQVIPLIKRGIKVKHIVIPDFLVVLAKSKSTMERTMTFLNVLTEEGITNIGSYINRGIEFKSDDNVKKEKVKAGVITSMTEQMYNKKKPTMNDFGFLSRFLVLRYNYSDDYLNNIFDEIFDGRYLDKEDEIIDLPKEPKNIIYDDKEIHEMITIIARNKIQAQRVEGYGIRLTIMLKTILKAIALKNNRDKVTKEDFDEFKTYEPLINYMGWNVATIS